VAGVPHQTAPPSSWVKVLSLDKEYDTICLFKPFKQAGFPSRVTKTLGVLYRTSGNGVVLARVFWKHAARVRFSLSRPIISAFVMLSEIKVTQF
jgi:hypothetical protein